MEDALKDIQSKLSASNVAQELFSVFAARWVSRVYIRSNFHARSPFSHEAVLDLGVQLLYDCPSKDHPQLLTDHIQRMASGEAPFFPTTLSLVYDKLVGKALPKGIASPSTLDVTSPSNLPAGPITGAVPSSATNDWAELKCARCRGVEPVQRLLSGLYCPTCPATGRNGKYQRGRPFMRCTWCSTLRDRTGRVCHACGSRFSY